MRSHSLRRLGGALILPLLAAACSIQTDDSARVIPEEQRGDFGEPETGDEAAGSNRIYLLTPSTPGEQQQLRAVQRDVASTPKAVLDSLFAGPNPDEQAELLGTAIPAALELLSARTVGRVLTVDIGDGLGDLTIEAVGLVVAQIVTSATELDNVESVRLQTNGEDQVWPLGNGGLEARPLTSYDYPGLIESTQPHYPAIPSAAG
jgi:hypothetical protein